MAGDNFGKILFSQDIIAYLSKGDKNKQELIDFDIKVTKKAFRILETLIREYGTSIIVVFIPFFKKITQQDQKNFQKELMTIRQLIHQVTEGKIIHQIIRIHKNVQNEQKNKNYKATQDQKIFNSQIQYLSQINFMLKNQRNKKEQSQINMQINRISDIKSSIKEPTLFMKYFENYLKTLIFETLMQQNKINEKNKSISKQLTSKQFSSKTKQQSQKPSFPPTSKQKKQSLRLCCRQVFQENQVIRITQTQRIQFKNYSLKGRNKFDTHQEQILLKTICSFLNGQGGIIYVGFFEKSSVQYVVCAQYDDKQIEAITRAIDVLAKQIRPPIEESTCRIDKIPVRGKRKNGCVFKVIIYQGNPEKLYYFAWDGKEYFCFRNNSSVDKFPLNQYVISRYRERLENPLPPAPPMHEGQCKAAFQSPSLGLQIDNAYANNRNDHQQHKRNKKLKKYLRQDLHQHQQRNKSMGVIKKNIQTKQSQFQEKIIVPQKIKKGQSSENKIKYYQTSKYDRKTESKAGKDKKNDYILKRQSYYIVYKIQNVNQLTTKIQKEAILQTILYEQIYPSCYFLTLLESHKKMEKALLSVIPQDFVIKKCSNKLIFSEKQSFANIEGITAEWQMKDKKRHVEIGANKEHKYLKFISCQQCAKAYCFLLFQANTLGQFLLQ